MITKAHSVGRIANAPVLPQLTHSGGRGGLLSYSHHRCMAPRTGDVLCLCIIRLCLFPRKGSSYVSRLSD